MKKSIAFEGKELKLIGRALQLNMRAPNFVVTDQDMKEVTLSDFGDKIKLITAFPSLDTPVCDLQIREFNKRAKELPESMIVIGISKDLPFAQKRFCTTFDIKNLTLLSDYRYSSFGIHYGFLIEGLNLLARGNLILDTENTLRYVQIVDELTHQPDYNDTLVHLDAVLKNPSTGSAAELSAELSYECKPCEGDVPPLPADVVNTMMMQHKNWELKDGKKIIRQFTFKNFVQAKQFLDILSIIAQEQGHHPSFSLIYNKLRVTLTTHSAGGLTENDFIMARIIDQLPLYT